MKLVVLELQFDGPSERELVPDVVCIMHVSAGLALQQSVYCTKDSTVACTRLGRDNEHRRIH